MDFSVKPVLSGPLTVLRPFTADDAEEMAVLMEDPEVIRFTGASPNPLSPEFLRSWYGSRGAQADRLDLAVTDRVSGELVGEVVLNEWDPEARSCTFRTWIGLEAYAFNSRALRVYEKVGFVREGIRREIEMKDGVWVDEVVMGVLEQEWAVHRGHPEASAVTSTVR